MPDHVVAQGDCMSSIAKQYGFDWQLLWNHSKNSSLKQRRKDPNVLFSGDTVYVPDRELGQEDRATDKLHSFKLKGFPCKVRLRLLLDDKPRANIKYILNIDGKLINGQTDGDGWLEQPIAPDAKEGKLTLPDANEEYPLQLGHLDPMDTVSGIKGRLNALGFYKGPIDNQLDDASSQAIAAFQKRQQLKPNGQLDQQTKDALKSAYGS